MILISRGPQKPFPGRATSSARPAAKRWAAASCSRPRRRTSSWSRVWNLGDWCIDNGRWMQMVPSGSDSWTERARVELDDGDDDTMKGMRWRYVPELRSLRMRGFHSSLLRRLCWDCKGFVGSVSSLKGPRSLVGSTCPLTKNTFVECLGYNYFSSRIEVTGCGKPEH